MAKEETTLIIQHFPAPRKQYFPPVVAAPIPPSQISYPSVEYEKHRAEKRGLTLEEYRRRIDLVRIAQSSSFVQHGDVVYPKKYADYEKFGACQVTGVCRHFDDYGDVEWRDNPLIVSLRSRKDASLYMVTDIHWYQKQAPIEETEAESC